MAAASPVSPRDMRTVAQVDPQRVLVLAPHPDDFDSVGVTMRLLRDREAAIRVAVLSCSPSGVEDSFCVPSTDERKAAIREQEQCQSCRFFGLPEDALNFLRLPEDDAAQPAENQANAARIQACLKAARPDWVFLPHGNDTNAGHQRTFRMFRAAAAREGRILTAFYIRDPKTVDMRIDAYTAFTEVEAEWKAELLRCHASQHQRNLNTRNHGFDDRILNVNRTIARELDLGAPYAEAFQIERLPGPQIVP